MLSRTRSTAATTLCRRSNFLRSFSTSHEFEDRDVVIVGGGPAGLALASALGTSRSPTRCVGLPHTGSSQAARSELKMTVVDAGDFSKIGNWSMDANKFSNRVSSLTNDSCRFLKGVITPTAVLHEFHTDRLPGIGAWDHVEQSRTCPIEEMQVRSGRTESSHP